MGNISNNCALQESLKCHVKGFFVIFNFSLKYDNREDSNSGIQQPADSFRVDREDEVIDAGGASRKGKAHRRGLC